MGCQWWGRIGPFYGQGYATLDNGNQIICNRISSLLQRSSDSCLCFPFIFISMHFLQSPMVELNILSLNVRCLDIPHKRASILEILQKKRADIALLQETHLVTKDTARLNNGLNHIIGFSSASTKSKGVAIVVRRNLNIEILEQIQDTQGRVVIVKMQIYNKNIALVSGYAPNSFDKKFYDTFTKMLLDLTDYSLIIGADFNAVWNHEKDRTSIYESSEQKFASAALRQWAFDLGVLSLPIRTFSLIL